MCETRTDTLQFNTNTLLEPLPLPPPLPPPTFRQPKKRQIAQLSVEDWEGDVPSKRLSTATALSWITDSFPDCKKYLRKSRTTILEYPSNCADLAFIAAFYTERKLSAIIKDKAFMQLNVNTSFALSNEEFLTSLQTFLGTRETVLIVPQTSNYPKQFKDGTLPAYAVAIMYIKQRYYPVVHHTYDLSHFRSLKSELSRLPHNINFTAESELQTMVKYVDSG